MRILSHYYSIGHSAQCARKSGLVHQLYTISSGDQSRSSRKLLNFQTLVTDLTGLAIANASLLDEGTAAAEAMTLSVNALPMARQKKPGKYFVVSSLCHPQTIAVLESRANGFGINIEVGDILADDCAIVKKQGENLIGVLAQYPDTEGGRL